MTSQLRPLLLTFVILNSSFPIQAAPPPELTVLRQQYDKVVAERVTAVFDASKSALDAKFTIALDNAIATAKGAGELKTVLALEAEKKRLADKLPIPVDDNSGPDTLQKLRSIYQEQLAKLEEARAANHSALLPAYTAKLQQLEVTLTKADRVAEAAEVLAYREGLVAGAPAAPLMADAPKSATNTPPPTQAATAKTPAIKPSEAAALNRQLAEWCLNNKHEIDIEANRRRSKIQNLQDLPKEAFELTRINYLESLPAGADSPFPWHTLPASPNLELIYLGFGDNDEEVTMDNLAHLGSSKALRELQLGGKGLRFVDLDLQKLPTIPTLRILTVFQFTKTAEIAVLHEKFPKLGAITFAFTEIQPETFEQLSKWPGLYSLRLDGESARLTAAHIAALSKLPELHFLILYPFSTVIDPSIKTLTRIDSVNLLYDCPIETFQAICSMPSLTTLQLGNNKNITDTDFAAITHLSKLTELKVYSMPSLTDACASSITELKVLNSVNLSGCPITDAVLPVLAKMKKLKKLEVRKTQITETGAAAFKKQRPDVEFTR